MAQDMIDRGDGPLQPGNPRLQCSSPPVDMLDCIPIALCCGCLRVFPTPPADEDDDLECPRCRCVACDCTGCIASIAALVMGNWHKAGLTRPDLVLSWHAEHGVRMREEA